MVALRHQYVRAGVDGRRRFAFGARRGKIRPVKPDSHGSPYGPPAAPPAEEKKPLGLFEETRSLYEGMLAEGMRRAAEREATMRPRGPLSKAVLGAFLASVFFAAAVGVYGIVTFPDAPIRATAAGAVGKTGRAYDREHFERFTAWKTALFAAFGVVLVAGVAMAVDDGRRKRKR